MYHLADQPRDRVTSGARVGIESHHVNDILRQWSIKRQEGGVAVAAQEEIELVQLSALALPAHPATLRRIVEPVTVQQVETRNGTSRRITLVQPGDLLTRVFQYLRIVCLDFHLSVVAVRPSCDIV